MVKSILLVGVGGQGTILASKILTTGLMQAGYDVKMSEIHGMSQRGGSVSSQVRYGDKVESPVIELGGADILVSFEKMEALRWLEYLKPSGKAVVNDFELPSTPILAGKFEYPKGILEEIAGKVETTVVNAAAIAKELGNVRTMNIILFGALVKGTGLTDIDWETVIRQNVKPNTIDINLLAYRRGLELVQI